LVCIHLLGFDYVDSAGMVGSTARGYIAAFALGTLFFWLNIPVLVWASAGLAGLGLIVGIFLKRAGYGVGGSKSKH
jgi:hypothetical protein